MRNKYEDGDAQFAKERGYDLIQLKYDGHWCRMVSMSNLQQYYSDTDRQFHNSTHPMIDCSLIGEFMRGTQWSKDPSRHGRFFIYDIWDINGPSLPAMYAERYKLLRRLATIFPPTFQVVQNYRMQEREAVWARYVEQEGYEGLIYRRSVGDIDDDIVREKKLFTLDGVVVDVKAGKGKHEGRMGALVVRLPSGATTDIGGGFDDTERELISINPGLYIGRTLEFVANAVFKSGAARHARFIRWRDDK